MRKSEASQDRVQMTFQQIIFKLWMLMHCSDLEGVTWTGLDRYLTPHISNNSSFRLKQPGVQDGSDGSDRTSYTLTENYTLPVPQAMGRIS
jgi:hypothetical protein